MFDHIEHRTESKVVAVTKEIEKTISPDKVTDMYTKVREQVEKDIIVAYRIENNELKGVVLVLNNQYDTMQKKLLGRYTLNGREYLMEDFTVSAVDYKEVAYTKLFEHFRTQISKQMMRETVAVTELFKR